DPRPFEGLWGQEAAAYDAAVTALAEGWASIEERQHLDLAIVKVDVDHPDAARASWRGSVLHQAAVHSATSSLRVATLAGRRYEVRYRYESWVRLVSRRPRFRVDLSELAEVLGAAETAGAKWLFDGAGAIKPAMRLQRGEESSITPGRFLHELCSHLEVLDCGPPAWDPYLVPGRSSA
ncbi:MAG: DUF6687 family protein, partial [Acidimicrobiales bacterium]